MYNNYLNEKGETLLTEKGCKDGKHPLIPIYSAVKPDIIHTVRWCPVCGAVIVDTDYKEVINSGQIMHMKKPDISKRTRDEE
jgi:hypothetical protein